MIIIVLSQVSVAKSHACGCWRVLNIAPFGHQTLGLGVCQLLQLFTPARSGFDCTFWGLTKWGGAPCKDNGGGQALPKAMPQKKAKEKQGYRRSAKQFPQRETTAIYEEKQFSIDSNNNLRLDARSLPSLSVAYVAFMAVRFCDLLPSGTCPCHLSWPEMIWLW